MSVGVAVKRPIHVGSGVGAHGHQTDVEGDVRALDLFGCVTAQMILDDRDRKTRVGGEARFDDVTQVDVA